MKFGIFYELQLPRPWGVDDERQLYQNALTQVELADQLGYDYAWEVEHHFLEEYSHSPAPEVFLAQMSPRRDARSTTAAMVLHAAAIALFFFWGARAIHNNMVAKQTELTTLLTPPPLAPPCG